MSQFTFMGQSLVLVTFLGFVATDTIIAANMTNPVNNVNTTCHFELTGRGWRVRCEKFDTISIVPKFPISISSQIYSLIIKNQPNFDRLIQSDMTGYSSLSELILINNGLRWIEPKTFIKNKYLKKIDLSFNRLETLDWRSMVNLRGTILDLSGNPLICNCSIFWLSIWHTQLDKPLRFLSPDGSEFFISSADAMTLPKDILKLDELKCSPENRTAQITLRTWATMTNRDSCALPNIRIDPKLITIKNTDQNRTIEFRCEIDSRQSLDLEFRQPVQMKVVDPIDTRNRMVIKKRILEDKSILNLSISQVSQGQMGWYVCLGLSASGANFDMAALVVESKPNLRLSTRNRTKSSDHSTDTFEFTIFAFPPPINFTWLKNNTTLNFTDEAYKHIFTVLHDETEQLKKKGFFYAFRTKLMIKFRYVPTFFEGNYSLVTCNEIGCDRLQFADYDKNSLPKGSEIDRFLLADTLGAHILTSTMEPKNEHGWLVAVVCMSFGLFLCLVGITIHYVRSRRKRHHTTTELGGNRRWWRRDPNVRDPSATRNLLIRTDLDAGLQLKTYTINAVYEPLLNAPIPIIPKASLEILKTLGEGAFGQVYLAYCKLDSTFLWQSQMKKSIDTATTTASSGDSDETRCLVAAKTLKQFTLDCSRELAREAELMAKLHHTNIVTFYGVCLKNGDNLLLLYEYMELGDLKRFLAVHGPHPELSADDSSSNFESTWRLSPNQLIDISCQIARGLAYLHDNHFVHRDLACRNCLVKSPLHVKLSDFGMTRDIYSSDYYRLNHKAPLPVRWLPPESLLYGRFSNLSDIWSYGVVVWEIVTFGRQPWGAYSNIEVMQRISAGEILEAPSDCPTVLGQLMADCWKRVPNERAKLDDIVLRLRRVSMNE